MASHNYCTCPHIDQPTVVSALERIRMTRSFVPKAMTTLHCCAMCNYVVYNTASFEPHFQQTGHSFTVRIIDPIELYCYHCREYVFVAVFDQILGRKRKSLCAALQLSSNVLSGRVSKRRGMVNMGATCFMSSVLQILLQCHPVTAAAKTLATETSHRNTESEPKACVACEFGKLCDATRSLTDHALTPSSMLYAVWCSSNYLAGYAQQDAHEFLIALIGGIDGDYKRFHPNNREESASVPPTTKPLPSVSDVLSGTIMSRLQCQHCFGLSDKLEPFVDLSLSIGTDDTESDCCNFNASAVAASAHAVAALTTVEAKRSSSADPNYPRSYSSSPRSPRINSKAVQSVADCLRAFTTTEELLEPVYCERCASNQLMHKQLLVHEPPKVLVLHLKRFNFLQQRKIDCRIAFDLHRFDLAPYMSTSAAATKNLDETFVTTVAANTNSGSAAHSDAKGSTDRRAVAHQYRLLGVVTHIGTLNQGHYISYVASMDAATTTWLKFDDELVTEVPEQEVTNAEGYILFYIRNDSSR